LIRLFASIRLRRRSREQRGRHSQSVALDYVVRGAVQMQRPAVCFSARTKSSAPPGQSPGGAEDFVLADHSQLHRCAEDVVLRAAVQLTMSSIRPRRGEVEERCGEKFFNNSLKINNQKITFLKQVDYVEFPKNHFLFIHHIQKRTRELFYKKKK
jgi:hypothetical protein